MPARLGAERAAWVAAEAFGLEDAATAIDAAPRPRHRAAGAEPAHHLDLLARLQELLRDPNLALYDAAHRSIPYHNGIYYNRWLKGIDVMLLKASGDTRSDKLRTILLMEADYNMNNKELSCKGMRLAKQANCIAPEQAGGRNRHTANESALNSRLIFDDSRSRRKAMAICSNNANGCFDRIVHSVA